MELWRKSLEKINDYQNQYSNLHAHWLKIVDYLKEQAESLDGAEINYTCAGNSKRVVYLLTDRKIFCKFTVQFINAELQGIIIFGFVKNDNGNAVDVITTCMNFDCQKNIYQHLNKSRLLASIKPESAKFKNCIYKDLLNALDKSLSNFLMFEEDKV